MDDKIKQFVILWNYRFPVDHWWREKHGIAFNSPKHRISNFWDQLFEFKEDKLYRDLYKDKNDYQIDLNDWLIITEDEITDIDQGVQKALEELEKFKGHGDQ